MRTLMRTVRRLAGVAIVLTLATTAMPPPAQAGHDLVNGSGEHEGIPDDMEQFVPTSENACLVYGGVYVDAGSGWGGISFDRVRHNHYQFNPAPLYFDCMSTNALLNARFGAYADGGTDGGIGNGAQHGESWATGWSHSIGYDDGSTGRRDSTAAASCDELTSDDDNKGDIWLENEQRGEEYSGWLKFVRSGTQMMWWGCAASHSDPNQAMIFRWDGELIPNDDVFNSSWVFFTGTGTAEIRDLSTPPSTTTTSVPLPPTTTTSVPLPTTTTTSVPLPPTTVPDPVPLPDVPLVDTVGGFEEPSADCKAEGGTRVVDSTTFGVESILYTYQPSADELWVCTRVEDTGSGDGYGGRLEVTPAGGAPSISGGPGDPSVDEASSACTTTTDPPNQIPTTHPMAHGGIGPVDYMIDAYSNDSEAWVCLQVDDTDTRVVVPFDDPVPEVSFGTMVTWWPDQGTPPS